ncbi:MAG: ABC transporter substrate-binding protein [Anaerolineae bacterium]
MRNTNSAIYCRRFIIALVAIPLLVRCTGTVSAPTPTPTTTPLPTPVAVTWSFWGDPWEVDINMRVINTFQVEYPHITILARTVPRDIYFDWLEAQWAQGQWPDVMFLDDIPLYAARGLLENLDPYIAKDDYDLSDFYPGLLELFKYQDSLYGLPRDNDTKVIFYNKQLFDEAGLPYPSDDWTWQDLRELALKLTRREDVMGKIVQYGFAYEPMEWWILWVWQNGGEVFDDDFAPTRTTINSPQAIEALQFLADLTNVDQVTPPFEVQRSSLSIGRLFQKGQLAMAFGNHALVPAFAQIEGLRWDVVGLPRGKLKVNVAGGAGYAISSRSQHKEAAWTFLKFLESLKGQALFTEAGVAVPARRSVGQSEVFLGHSLPYNARVFLEETELGRPFPTFSGASQVMETFDRALKPLWRGQETAQEVIEKVVPKVNALLEAPR